MLDPVGLRIKNSLLKNHLSQTWLMAQLEKFGIRTDSTELSAALSGRRKGPKVEQVIEASLKIVENYEWRMNDGRKVCS